MIKWWAFFLMIRVSLYDVQLFWKIKLLMEGLIKIQFYLDCPRDIDFVIQRVEEAGGLVVEPKTIISRSLGYYATFEDLEGNYIYLHSLKKTTSL